MKLCFVGLDNLPQLDDRYAHLGTGGEQVQQTLLAQALAERGHEVHMIVADHGQAARWVKSGITVHKAFAPQAGWPGLRFVHPRITGLWRALDRVGASHLYLSCASPQLGVAVAWARRHGARCVFRVAHDWDCQPRSELIRYAHNRALYSWGLKRADAVLAQNQRQVEDLALNFGVEARLADMLVEPAPPSLGFAKRPVDVLWVNNLRPFKRPGWVLDLARSLPQLSFVMVGGPQPGYAPLYDEIAQQARLLPNLRFLGQRAYATTQPLFGQARVLLNTSEAEGFPNAYLQAWRSGTPVVTPVDPDGLIAAQGLGRVAHSAENLARALDTLCRRPQRWQALHQRCLDWADECLDWNRTVDRYEQALLSPNDEDGVRSSRAPGRIGATPLSTPSPEVQA